MYYVLCSVTMGLFVTLTVYVDAFYEDFKTIIDEMNDEISLENENSSRSRSCENDTSTKLIEAIVVHCEIFK